MIMCMCMVMCTCMCMLVGLCEEREEGRRTHVTCHMSHFTSTEAQESRKREEKGQTTTRQYGHRCAIHTSATFHPSTATQPSSLIHLSSTPLHHSRHPLFCFCFSLALLLLSAHRHAMPSNRIASSRLPLIISSHPPSPTLMANTAKSLDETAHAHVHTYVYVCVRTSSCPTSPTSTFTSTSLSPSV